MLGQIRRPAIRPGRGRSGTHTALSRPEPMVVPGRTEPRLASCWPALASDRTASAGSRRNCSWTRIDSRCRNLLAALTLRHPGSSPSEAAVLAGSLAYRESHRLEPEPAPFVGEAPCAPCHAEIPATSTTVATPVLSFARIARRSLSPGADRRPRECPRHSRFRQTAGRARNTDPWPTDDVYQTIVDYAFGSGDKGPDAGRP